MKADLAGMGERLKQARERVGLTQEEVAEHLRQQGGSMGVRRPTVSNWENGRNMPCLVQFRELCALYGVTGYQIMFGKVQFEMSMAESRELAQALRNCSPGLRLRVDVLLSLLAPTSESRAEA